MSARLYIFGGLPGTGKTTLASALARELGAVLVRADTIECAMRRAGITLSGPEGYIVGYAVATENLKLGISVVTDCVNPFEITRQAWRQAAIAAEASYVEIEVICSDPDEHRRRIESRETGVSGSEPFTWQHVQKREYQPWTSSDIVIETAKHSPDQSLEELGLILKPIV